MKRLMCTAIFLSIALPVFAQEAAQGPEGFVGDWKSDPGTPTMTRKLELQGKIIVMTELQPGRNGGPELTIIRKYPTDGSEVTMDTGMWNGSKVTGKMEGNVLTCDTTMPNGRKFHDVWTLAADGKHYTNDMVISGGPAPSGAPAGGGTAGGGTTAGGTGGGGTTGGGTGGGGTTGGRTGGGGTAGGGAAAPAPTTPPAPRTVKFSFTRVD